MVYVWYIKIYRIVYNADECEAVLMLSAGERRESRYNEEAPQWRLIRQGDERLLAALTVEEARER